MSIDQDTPQEKVNVSVAIYRRDRDYLRAIAKYDAEERGVASNMSATLAELLREAAYNRGIELE